MHANDANNTNPKEQEPIYKDLSYAINGVLFATHNELGPYAREKQYGDVAVRIFTEKGHKCDREQKVGESGNIIDIVIDNKVALEFKAKRILTKEDYYQTNAKIFAGVRFKAWYFG